MTNFLLAIKLWFIVHITPGKLINTPSPIEKEGWQLTFNDEFDKGEVDYTKWRDYAYFGYRFHEGNIFKNGTAPDEYYAEDAFTFTDSTIKISTKRQDTEIEHIDWDGKNWGKFTIPYRVGHLESVDSFEQKYGYFEARIKFGGEPGHWDAWWLASKYAWPPEIDILERWSGKYRERFNSTLHWGKVEDGTKGAKGYKNKVKSTYQDFHIYSCEWNEENILIFYDGLLINKFKTPKDFIHPMHLIINTGVSMSPKERLDEAMLPDYMEVDYVRAYTKK